MTVGSLVAYQIGDDLDGAVVAATMLLTTLSLFHVVAGLLSRDQLNTIFDRDALPGVAQLRRYGVSLLAIVAITTHRPPRSGSSGPPDSTADQWAHLHRTRRRASWSSRSSSSSCSGGARRSGPTAPAVVTPPAYAT